MKISDCEVDYVLKQKAVIKTFLNPFSFHNVFPHIIDANVEFLQKMQNNWTRGLLSAKKNPCPFLLNQYISMK